MKVQGKKKRQERLSEEVGILVCTLNYNLDKDQDNGFPIEHEV